MTRSSVLPTDTGFCTIQFARAGAFEGDELFDIKHDIQTFLQPVVLRDTLRERLNDERQLYYTFECNIQALPIIHAFLFISRDYDDRYSVTVDYVNL